MCFGVVMLYEVVGWIGVLLFVIKLVVLDMCIVGFVFMVYIFVGDNLWIYCVLYEVVLGDVLVVLISGGIEWGYWGDIFNIVVIE